jgi:hypothetical protein
MMMQRSTWVLSALLVFLVVFLVVFLGRSSVAAACTLPPYEDVFVPSGTIPDDAFAAEIGDPSRSLPALVDATGTAVELASSPGPGARWTVKPVQALVPGAHYTFRYQLGRRFDLTDTVAQSVDFVAGPSAPAPEVAGTLRVQVDPATTSSELQTFHVLWDRAPALQAFASLLEIHYQVDGMELSDLSVSPSGQSIDRVCDRPQPVLDSCGDVMGVLAGRHTVTLTARVYGSAAPLPILSTSIDVQCQTQVPLGNDAYQPEQGCAVAGGAGRTGLAGLAAAGAFLWWTRRRRGVRFRA